MRSLSVAYSETTVCSNFFGPFLVAFFFFIDWHDRCHRETSKHRHARVNLSRIFYQSRHICYYYYNYLRLSIEQWFPIRGLLASSRCVYLKKKKNKNYDQKKRSDKQLLKRQRHWPRENALSKSPQRTVKMS